MTGVDLFLIKKVVTGVDLCLLFLLMQLLSSCTLSAEELTFRVKRPCFYLSTKSCQQQGRTIMLILRATPPKVRSLVMWPLWPHPRVGQFH